MNTSRDGTQVVVASRWILRRDERGELEGASLEDGKLKISRPKKEPGGMEEFSRLLYSLVPRVKLTDLLVEVDSWCHFSGRFTHLKTGDPAKDKEVLYAALMADGVNLGLTKMVEATDDARITTRGSPGSPTATSGTTPARQPLPSSSTSSTARPSPGTGAKTGPLRPTASATRPAGTGTLRARSTRATVVSPG